MNTEKPLRRRTRDQIDLIVTLFVNATQQVECCQCQQRLAADDMFFDASTGDYRCSECTAAKSTNEVKHDS